MAEANTKVVGDKYVLPTGKTDEARLNLLGEVYGPITLRGLEAANIKDAERIADIGCGNGSVSRLMAAIAGACAQVNGIDISPDQVKVAKTAVAEEKAARLTFTVGSAYDSGLPESSFDLVFCRTVLCHLKERSKAVEHMAKLLKPKGRLVLVDIDIYAQSTMPPCEALNTYLAENVKLHENNIGTDYGVGTRLHELLSGADLETVFLASDQPIFQDGAGKQFWLNTFRSALPYVAAAGTVTPQPGDLLLDRYEKHIVPKTVWVSTARMFAAVGQKKQS